MHIVAAGQQALRRRLARHCLSQLRKGALAEGLHHEEQHLLGRGTWLRGAIRHRGLQAQSFSGRPPGLCAVASGA